VALVRLQPDPTVARDPLFAQILRRHTNRNVYDPPARSPMQAWQAMAAAVRATGCASATPAAVMRMLPRHASHRRRGLAHRDGHAALRCSSP
jgi:hypothetical protein